ncbi:deoxyribodipyrimidine photo-lyase [Candidatus Babeliales bacterium]|nr:deoxyribodipyrimidine photo-lyase [Candidatus Babeliales bacterium]MBP9843671.1 deoxyribodipyrimidine photo-lyase [Candidatus Babeliales bacterium]
MIDEQKTISIFWFRKDLRLADNLGLHTAAQAGDVLPVFIVDEKSIKEVGQASLWWLYHSLQKLDMSLHHNLNFYVGDPEKILVKLAKKYNVNKVFFNRVYEPKQLEADAVVIKYLKDHDVDVLTFAGDLLWEPWQVVKSDKTAYKVYTPFYRYGCLSAQPPRQPLSEPKKIDLIKDVENKTTLNLFDTLFGNDWKKDRKNLWEIGEVAAKKRLQDFLSDGFDGYKVDRDFPSRLGVSRLSPHLHFGEISPQQIWYGIQQFKKHHNIPDADIDCFYKQLAWREFSYNLLYHFPDLPDKNFQKKFDNFPWRYNQKFLHAWQQGQTGYPLVDAGMRELLQTGYMHNRVRMVVASFLVKNLLIDWRRGRDWFWDTLVDADLANNSASWQWVAGCGVDAAPYFRIFNPTTQGKKFDKEGEYTRQFVPELKLLPDKFLFEPWKAPENILRQAKVELGKNYPHPIVSIEDSRKLALAAYKTL